MTVSEYEYEHKKESNRPLDSKFLQQTLPAIQPILHAKTVAPTLLIISIVFIPFGVSIWLYSQNVVEIVIPYTNCTSVDDPARTCEEIILEQKKNLTLTDCKCEVSFSLNNNELNKGGVYIFYYLTNFYYQNHKDFFDSKDIKQLKGKLGTYENPAKPSSNCGDDYSYDAQNRTIWPCGAVANWMFSDTITLHHINYDVEDRPSELNSVPLIRTGIAMKSTGHANYVNPEQNISDQIWLKFGKPKDWKKTPWELDKTNMSNNGIQNEDFAIWMQISAFPSFRKLYRVVNTTASNVYRRGLPPGNYTLQIEYDYSVSQFQGTKSIILTTKRIIGAQNHFLGIAYLTVGGTCLLFAIILTIVHFATAKQRQSYKHDLTKVD